ncbi:hypothetical protein COT49_01645 [candidate division WWE3 bacterium CG08_land_8_20_14_0_20_40_13]|uniref:Uncharacterized protein n=1 Tax=candidate division WWE3 bacterium CG08_land_8_20_14_0_20_40_13 TaxID=1975084 RepID=A0A2H0XDY6_UNCKA|nr:MAG: hypothetical protein COT49_01645 [candidate division WWE3 bacterium CG08_land_8_20_14_0_20_40_13]
MILALLSQLNPGGKGVEGPLANQKIGSSTSGFGETVNALISAAFVIGGLAFVVVFIMGAFSYITSAGDEKMLEKARNSMWDGVVGFVILAVTFLVVDIISNIFGFPILGLTFVGL